MFDQVQSIMLEKLNTQLQELSIRSNALKDEAEKIKNELENLTDKQEEGFQEKNFSLFQKLFNSKKYKTYINDKKEFDKLSESITQTRQSYEAKWQEYTEETKSSGQIQLYEQIEKVKNAETLYDIDIAPSEAVNLLKSLNIQPVLNESDLVLTKHDTNYESKSSLIAVHKTPYMQGQNMLKTPHEVNAKESHSFTVNDQEYTYTYNVDRNTIHFAMNDEVSSHLSGQFNEYPYAYLVPFDKIPNEIIGQAAPVDMFITKGIELPENTWIFCPEEEVEMVQSKNPNVNVLGYKGDKALGYPQPFLTQLGYRAEDVGMWNWSNESSAKQFHELITQKEGLSCKFHSDTHYHEDEGLLNNINQIVGLCSCLRDNNLISSESSQEEISSVLEQLSHNHKTSFEFLTANFFTPSSVPSDLSPDALKADNKHIDIFINKMNEGGFTIPEVYQDLLKSVADQTVQTSSKDIIDINIPSNASANEQAVLMKLNEKINNKDFNRNQIMTSFMQSLIVNSIEHSKTQEIESPEIDM